MSEIPELPYDDGQETTSGWAGSDTSRERAVHADTSGLTKRRQETVLSYLIGAGSHGCTWRELDEAYPDTGG